MRIEPNTPLNQLPRVGYATIQALKKLGIITVNDLLFYYPFRYEDYSQVQDIDSLEVNQSATIRGKVELVKNRRTPRRRMYMTEAMVSDLTGEVRLIWFNQPWIGNNLKPGSEIFVSGKLAGSAWDLYFGNPNYEPASQASVNTARLLPFYSLTEGITQKQFRFVMSQALPAADLLQDYLPEQIISSQKLISLSQAVLDIHAPDSQADLTRARQRLSFDEVFLLQVWSQILKKRLQAQTAIGLAFKEAATKEFVSRLPFTLTDDQKKAGWEILQDLQLTQPMNRMLEGDVGAGKTVVVALALYNTALNHAQGVLMAPTEILATQHYQTLLKLFSEVDFNLGILTRNQALVNGQPVDKKTFLKHIQAGQVQVVVGTHALIQRQVAFNNLALAVIDEQHRFGVKQRLALKQKAQTVPHFLSLTATPIPRSLALALYGDLDLSVIKSRPQGRKPIQTRIVEPGQRQTAYQFISQAIQQGRQVFVVCPLIDESDKLGLKSVKQVYQTLSQQVFPDIPIGLLHGKLKAADKDQVMSDFVQARYLILVATSVIEVGVDVPNASIMLIEGAERFGLAQLHQLRGRVGRGKHQSHCLLMTDQPSAEIMARLKLLVTNQDGFSLAQKDLELRGSGQVYGDKQSGWFKLRLASLSDLKTIKRVKQLAEVFVSQNEVEDYPELVAKLDSLNLGQHLE